MHKNSFAVMTDFLANLPLYVTSVGESEHQERIDRPTGYPHYHWLQTFQGKGVFHAGEHEYHVAPGQGVLLYPNEQHRYNATVSPWSVKWVTFSGAAAESVLAQLGLEHTKRLYMNYPQATHKLFMDIESTMHTVQPVSGLEASSLLYKLLLALRQHGSLSELRAGKPHSETLGPVLRYLEEHYSKPIALPELASLIAVTPQHICTLFQQGLGMRPMEYLARIRIRKAKELLLRHPGEEIQAIGSQVGYEHASYFIKVFKQHEGTTPAQFRQIHLMGS